MVLRGYLLLSVFVIFIILYKFLHFPYSEEIVIPVSSKFTVKNEAKPCTIHTCLDLRKCVNGDNLAIYVQPLLKVTDEDGHQQNPEPLADFLELRQIILLSRHSVESFEESCLVLPGIDTLTTNRFSDPAHLIRSLNSAASVFPSKPNFIVFNFFGSTANFGDAIVISSMHLVPNFRRYFDIQIPAKLFPQTVSGESKTWGLAANILFPLPFGSQNSNGLTNKLQSIGTDVKILLKCLKNSMCIDGKEIDYNFAMKSVDFVIITEEAVGFDHILTHTLQSGAIPVFVSDLIVRPFGDFIEWSSISFTFSPKNPKLMIESLQITEKQQILKMKTAAALIFSQHFNSFPTVIHSTLMLLEQRLIPTRIQPLSELFSSNSLRQKPYIYASDYFIVAISHQKTTPEEKLKWMLRYFLYTKTNAKVILLITETAIQHIFQEFVVTSNPLDIEIFQVLSIEQLPYIVHDYDPYCLAFIVDSSYPSSHFDENILNMGFAAAATFPQRATHLISTECPEKHQCPLICHTSLFPNNRVKYVKNASCVSLTEPLKTSNHSWISCPL